LSLKCPVVDVAAVQIPAKKERKQFWKSIWFLVSTVVHSSRILPRFAQTAELNELHSRNQKIFKGPLMFRDKENS